MSNEVTIMNVDSPDSTGSEGLPVLERADPPDVIHEQPDSPRRRALVAATIAVGGIGVKSPECRLRKVINIFPHKECSHGN
jgi:hypothetical protein